MTGIAVTPMQARHAADFRRLNLEWIERLFKVEAPDLEVLNDPVGSIIERGGMVFVALDGDAVVGTAAMIRVTPERYELAKMAVATTHQQRGIGNTLGLACTTWAAQHGARVLFLETNSALDGAIRLYERLGFRHAPWPHPSDYARGDVYMEKKLDSARS
ncbi:MAG TPA: GNAT family N-acetyltransferase [Steroidobacteraceae bacterium]|nr:GNAT family N-acetyltransferase [Steroidobacteraceae bacterium]